MADRDALIVRPFGRTGSRYRVTARGLIFHRINVGWSVVALLSLVIVYLVTNSAINIYVAWVVAIYFFTREIFLALTLNEATRVE